METIVKNATLDLKGSAINFMFTYAEQDMETMMSLCDTEGEVWFKPLGEGGRGKIGELGKGLWTALIDSFPDLNNTVDSAALDSDGNVRCQVTIRGKQAKDFAGIKCQDQQFDSDHIFIFKHNPNGKINSIHIQWDHADFQKQLGS
jgi:SnoaL-like polyketide cyclase